MNKKSAVTLLHAATKTYLGTLEIIRYSSTEIDAIC